jgi:hypothetical protein
MKNGLFRKLGSAAILFIAASSASAQVIVPTNPTSPVVTNSVQADGYYLFDTYPDVANHPGAADINELPAYATLTQEAPIYGPEGETSDLTVNGTAYEGDGVAYANSGAATGGVPGTGAPVEFATFQLGSGTPATFQVGLLSNYEDTTYYSLSLYSSDPNTGPAQTPLYSVMMDPDQTRNPGQNEFYYADVVGATTGDYLVADGYTSNNYNAQVTLGGVTFNTVPEPCTFGMLLAGLGAVCALARRRLSA